MPVLLSRELALLRAMLRLAEQEQRPHLSHGEMLALMRETPSWPAQPTDQLWALCAIVTRSKYVRLGLMRDDREAQLVTVLGEPARPKPPVRKYRRVEPKPKPMPKKVKTPLRDDHLLQAVYERGGAIVSSVHILDRPSWRQQEALAQLSGRWRSMVAGSAANAP